MFHAHLREEADSHEVTRRVSKGAATTTTTTRQRRRVNEPEA
jgi:hypothetical protein